MHDRCVSVQLRHCSRETNGRQLNNVPRCVGYGITGLEASCTAARALSVSKAVITHVIMEINGAVCVNCQPRGTAMQAVVAGPAVTTRGRVCVALPLRVCASVSLHVAVFVWRCHCVSVLLCCHWLAPKKCVCVCEFRGEQVEGGGHWRGVWHT
jgi:hypothetical protein